MLDYSTAMLDYSTAKHDVPSIATAAFDEEARVPVN
jgi:hypothetical protein